MIRFGIAGTGRISDWVLKGAALDSRFKATAVCSRKEHTADTFISSHPQCFAPGARIYTSIEDMVLDKEVDAVYIGTPNTTHYSYAITAIKAGKHVLCEKPMACSEKEVKEMFEEAKKAGVVLMEAMISTLQPAFRAMVEKIEEISPIRQVNFNFCQYSSKYEALKRGEMFSSLDPLMGGGAIEDIGIYTVFPLISLFGEPDEVKSSAIFIDSPHGKVEVHGNACLNYTERGINAQLCWSKICDSSAPSEICGEKGTLRLDSIHSSTKASMFPHAAPSSGRGVGASETVLFEGPQKDSYFYEFKEFMDVIEKGATESVVNSHKASILTRRVMDKIIDSSRNFDKFVG